MKRIFLISPARCDGKRAAMLLNENAAFDLARRVREPAGASLGETFAFLSGLYFRGKLTYANTFCNPPAKTPGVLVITPTRGLLPPEHPTRIEDLREFAAIGVNEGDPRYRRPLERDLARLRRRLDPSVRVVLLGSIATGKYVDVLLRAFGWRLEFPPSFVGRGDMSRGGICLRAAADRSELEYAPLEGAVRHGVRPDRLPPRSRKTELVSPPRLSKVEP